MIPIAGLLAVAYDVPKKQFAFVGMILQDLDIKSVSVTHTVHWNLDVMG